MKATLLDILKDINNNKKDGLLSIIVKGSQYLLKIFFDHGEIYYMVYGDTKGAGCLTGLDRLEFSECAFFPGVKLNVTGGMNLSGAELIERFKAESKIVEGKDFQAGAAGIQNITEVMSKLKLALIRQIGPIGDIILSDAVAKWTTASHGAGQGLTDLVDILKDRIPDASSREEFVRESMKIIS